MQRQASWGRYFWISLNLVCIGLLLTSQEVQASSALDIWNNEARANLPRWLMIWLGFLALTFISSIFFVWHHVAPRWVLGGFVGSHVAAAIIENNDEMVLRAGLVSLLHVIFWTPGLIALILKRHEIQLPKPYGIWACTILFVYLVAFIFDIRDSVIWLHFMLTQ